MWTYTGLAFVSFLVLAVALETATRSSAMTPVQVTEPLRHAALTALIDEELGRPVVKPINFAELRAMRMANGHYLVCGTALSELPDEMTGFSVQLVETGDGSIRPERTYVDRKADRLCNGGRIPLLSLGVATD